MRLNGAGARPVTWVALPPEVIEPLQYRARCVVEHDAHEGADAVRLDSPDDCAVRAAFGGGHGQRRTKPVIAHGLLGQLDDLRFSQPSWNSRGWGAAEQPSKDLCQAHSLPRNYRREPDLEGHAGYQAGVDKRGALDDDAAALP